MSKPTESIDWATVSGTDPISGQPNKVEPNTDHKEDGWSYQEKPPNNYFNYWMNAIYKFITYIVSEALEGAFTFVGNKIFSGTINNTNTTESSSTTTGAFKCAGGGAFVKNLHVGGNTHTTGTTQADGGEVIEDYDGVNPVTTLITKTRRLKIGAWNMNGSSGGSFVTYVKHGFLNSDKIQSVKIIIYDDSGGVDNKVFSVGGSYGGLFIHTVDSYDALSIIIVHEAGSMFDNSTYNDTGINRGYLLIKYFV